MSDLLQLSQRRQRSTIFITEKETGFWGMQKATIVVAANVKSSSLMERHNSAERIS